MNHSVFILCTSFHSLGRVLFGYGPSVLQFGPYFSLLLVCGSTNVPVTPVRCFCHVTTWLVLAGPAMYFSFIQFTLASAFCWVNPHTMLGFLDLFYSFGHPSPIPFLHSHWLLLRLLGFPDPITIFFNFGVC